MIYMYIYTGRGAEACGARASAGCRLPGAASGVTYILYLASSLYRGTSLIRTPPLPKGHHMAPDIVLL